MIKLVIFDLDGVIVSTDDFHYKAWQNVANSEGIHFDRIINNRLRGVSREQSLEIILKSSSKIYTQVEKTKLLNKKNELYLASLEDLSSNVILSNVLETIDYLKSQNIKVAIGSSSKNAKFILSKIGLNNAFDCIVDGNMISYTKPNPEVFNKCCEILNINQSDAIVIEDAVAGIDAARSAGMIAIGIGDANNYGKCHYRIKNVIELIPLLETILE